VVFSVVFEVIASLLFLSLVRLYDEDLRPLLRNVSPCPAEISFTGDADTPVDDDDDDVDE